MRGAHVGYYVPLVFPGIADDTAKKPMVGRGQRKPHGAFAGGQRLGLAENTLVVLMSDNGGYTDYQGRHPGEISSNAPFRAGKTSLYEGGHRVPAIAWWPGRITAGRISEETALTMDLVPTALELAGLPAVTAADQPSDGVSLVPHLLRHAPLPERTVFRRVRRHLAARSGPWKRVLAEDRPELVARLRAKTEAWTRDVDGSFARLQTTDPSARRVR